ncbi:MAG: ArsA-related P-loop ATPase [Candidatus Binataceae bacterium]
MALPRLIFITGKGGTGKSTLAAALALALARRRPTVLADLEGRFSAARILGARLDNGGPTQAGKNLEAIGLSPRAELEAFIERIVPLKAISRRMLRSHTFGYVTAALPGLEAFLMLERLRAMAGESALEDRYVVIDAPATGSALELLSVAGAIQEIAPSGTLNRLAAGVGSFLTDPDRFGVAITLTPEELATREAIEAAHVLSGKLGINRIVALLSGVAEPLFDAAELVQLAPLEHHARLAHRRVASADAAARARREMAGAGLRTVEIPMLFEPALSKALVLEVSRRLEEALLDR